MFKKPQKLIFLILLLVTVVWILTTQNEKKFGVQQPNVVSKTDGPHKSTEAELSHKKPKHSELKKSTSNESVKEVVDLKNVRSFLDVYKDIQLAKECSHFYKENHKLKGQYDFLKVLNDAHKYRMGMDELAPEIQQEALDRFVGFCLSLKEEVFNRAKIIDDYPEYQFAYPVLVELRKEFNTTLPNTDVEKELFSAIRLGAKWQQQATNLRNVSAGDFKRSKKERDVLQSEIDALGDEIRLLYQNYPIDSNELSRLDKEIEQIYELQFERLPTNPEKLKQAQQAFNTINAQYLNQAKLPNVHVFKEVMLNMHFNDNYDLAISALANNYALNGFQKIVKIYASPSEIIKNHAQIFDSSLYDIMIKPAGYLYLCYLGDDCGPDSTYVREYCLDLDNYHTQMYVDACGKNLIDFYTDEYLTANQWLDVSYLFDVMVDYYEN